MKKDIFEQFDFITKRDISFIRSITSIFNIEEQKDIELKFATKLQGLTCRLMSFERPSQLAICNRWLRNNYEQKAKQILIQKLIETSKKHIKEKTAEKIKKTYRADISSFLLRKFSSFKNTTEAVKFIEEFNSKYADFRFYSFDDRDIFKLSIEAAEHCKDIQRRHQKDLKLAVKIMHKYAVSLHIKQATAQANNLHIIINKYADDAFFRPRLRRVIRRKREEIAIECGFVSKAKTHYSSKFTQSERKQQLDRNKKWAKKTLLKCEDKTLKMSDLVASKEKCYQAELVTMLKGLRDIQDENNFDAALITVTCPATFRRIKITAAESADHLRLVWSRSRAQAKREGLNLAGMQVWQPHKNAIAHQHIYCVAERSELERFAQIIKEQALKLYPNELGAQEHRCDVMFENQKKGRLASYAARYVTRLAKKNNEETCATDLATAEDAWYSAHSIRRVSFFGLPPKKIWNYFRSVTRSICNTRQLRQIRKAARNGQYAKFCEKIQWTGLRKELDYETLTEPSKNKYEEITTKEIGIRFQTIQILKSTKKWILDTVRTVINNCPRKTPNNTTTFFESKFNKTKKETVPIPF